jgi:hypothetical protein
MGDTYAQIDVARELAIRAKDFLATETFSFSLVVATRWSLTMTTVSNYEFVISKI